MKNQADHTALAAHLDGNRRAAITRRKLLKAGAVGLGVAAFPAPLIAQTKPFAGVTLHGASFQHRFFTLLANYIPEFEAQTGMKVDLQLSAFPVYNQQANLELSSGGSAFDFVNVTFILAARWVAAGLLANLDEFTSDPNLTPTSTNFGKIIRDNGQSNAARSLQFGFRFMF